MMTSPKGTIQRNLIVTLVGVVLERAHHIQTCERCKTGLDCNNKNELDKVVEHYRLQEKWNPPAKRDPLDGTGPFYYFHPRCRHERTSWDLMTCERCLRHSQEVQDQ